MEDKKKKLSLKMLLLLQGIVMIYTLSGVAAKFASGTGFLSLKFILFYGLEIFILGIYAILWQQIIKRIDLSVAYANRSLALLWMGHCMEWERVREMPRWNCWQCR